MLHSRFPVVRFPITVSLSVALFACGGGAPPNSPTDAVQPAAVDEHPLDEPNSPVDDTEFANESPDDPEVSAEPIGVESERGNQQREGDDFERQNTGSAKTTHGVQKSNLKPTKTEAHVKFVVVDKQSNEPIDGVIVSLTGADGKKYHTQATDAVGFAEVLVPKGQKYEVMYLSLRGKDIAADLNVEDKERFTLKLTLRYKGWEPIGGQAQKRLVLEGVQFDTGKATIRPGSFERLDSVVEYMTYNKSARVEISGHTDNVGKQSDNKALSQKRAEACREYVISKGIDASRVTAVGYGDERPIASNNTAEGRQQNRRIEAQEL
jgi:outer membrane protein OmpA-like peptidoglycan-associated protein